MLIMAKTHDDPTFDRNAPQRLIDAWYQAGRSDRKLARALELKSHYWVSKLLWYGIEPDNVEIRVKLFLPRHPRVRKVDDRPEWLKRVQKNIRIMSARTRRDVLKRWRK